jgi:succinate dehydrogenase / fumarate reductase cytochrome b subunit
MNQRPLSPHLAVYRFTYNMALSILHRIAGIALSLGLCVVVFWLLSAAAGHDDYQRAAALLSGWPFRLLLLAWLAAFTFHLGNGLRHLAWDAGFGFAKQQARRSAALVIAGAAAGFLLAALLLFWPPAGAP